MTISAAPVFLGDELSAAGFRLAGAITRTPAPGEAGAALAWARQQAPLVLVTAELAQSIPSALLNEALTALTPLVVIVPDLRGRSAPADLAAAVKRDLGIEAVV